MCRFLRILLNAATVLSLVLSMVVVVLWMRSYVIVDNLHGVRVQRPGNTVVRNFFELKSDRGDLVWFRRAVWAGQAGGDPPEASQWGWQRSRRPPGTPVDVVRNLREFRWDSWSSGTQWTRVVTVPHWLLMVAAGLLPGGRLLLRHRRSRRKTPGRCHLCGYDLRATPDRCPECGAIPKIPDTISN